MRLRSVAFFFLCVALIGLVSAAVYGLYLAAEKSAGYAPAPPKATATPLPTSRPDDARVKVTAADLDGGDLRLTIEAAQFGGDVLFEPPVLMIGAEQYPPTAKSLEAAHFGLLDNVTGGRATTVLVFADLPSSASEGVLIFNPGSDATRSVNPRIAVPVSWRKSQ